MRSRSRDHLVETDQIRRADKLVKPKLDARQIDHPAVVAQGFIELLFAGDLFGDIKLPANFTGGIKQRHAVPARGGIHRKRQPSGQRPPRPRFYLPSQPPAFWFHGRRGVHQHEVTLPAKI